MKVKWVMSQPKLLKVKKISSSASINSSTRTYYLVFLFGVSYRNMNIESMKERIMTHTFPNNEL